MWWCAARGSPLFHALGLAASLIKSGHINVNKIYVHGAWPHYPATQLAGAYPSGRIPILLYAVEKDGWGLGTGRKRHAEKKRTRKREWGERPGPSSTCRLTKSVVERGAWVSIASHPRERRGARWRYGAWTQGIARRRRHLSRYVFPFLGGE